MLPKKLLVTMKSQGWCVQVNQEQIKLHKNAFISRPNYCIDVE